MSECPCCHREYDEEEDYPSNPGEAAMVKSQTDLRNVHREYSRAYAESTRTYWEYDYTKSVWNNTGKGFDNDKV